MKTRRIFKRGWLGNTVCYAYLTILSICAAFPIVLPIFSRSNILILICILKFYPGHWRMWVP